MRMPISYRRTAVVVLGGVLVALVGCATSKRAELDETSSDEQNGGPKDPFSDRSDMTPPRGCVGLECQQHHCDGKGTTSVTGTVYDPAGNNPLYNVVVYVPNAPLEQLPEGATCDSCDALYSGSPLVATTTDAHGRFVLEHVPAGKDIPLVVQVGKWRKRVTIPSVEACTTQELPDRSLTLPKNRFEGDIPSIAISTGGSDSLECLLRRVGIDASEYGPGGAGPGRIHIFRGGLGFLDGSPNTSPGAPQSGEALWSSKADLMKYDVVLLSCEGSETTSMNRQALFDYAAAGGRVFASHFHYAWLNEGPFASANLATWKAGTNDMGDVNATIVTTFPKGKALHAWLSNVSALTNGELPISQAKHNASVTSSHSASTEWIVANARATPAHATQYFTFNTPVGAPAESQCGRVVYSDLHVGAASRDYAKGGRIVPDGCASGELSPQEKALEFMLFDLSSCVTPDSKPPEPPPTSPR